MSHLKLHYCLRHPMYGVYIDQRILYALSLHMCVLCHIYFALVYVCVCSCVCLCIPAHVLACMWGCNTKSSSVPVDTKPAPHTPAPTPLFLFPWGRDKTVCLSACSQQEGGWGPGWEVMEVVGWGQSSRVYSLDVSVGGLKKGTVTSGILMLI